MSQYDDGSGKRKIADTRARNAILSTIFILSACLGIIVSEKLYLKSQEDSTPKDKLQYMRSQKLETGASFKRHTTLHTQQKQPTTITANLHGKPRNKLETILQQVAPAGEVMIAISNYNLVLVQSLPLWLKCVQRANINNFLVVAIDTDLRDYLETKGINYYYRPVKIPSEQKKTGDNHAVSAMKYEIIEEFLALGWNVLLSDVDIVTISNPFDALYRDSDVEGMSDGFTPETSYGAIYGVDDPTMGWARYAQGTQHMAMNSGLFYLLANERTISLMQRIAKRVSQGAIWDQSVYNQELFFLTHGEYKSTGVSVRVMDIYKFMNTKTLFKFVRNDPLDEQRVPVMVHANYHPDKLERMKAVVRRFIDGDVKALDGLPGGSEPGS